MRLKRRAGYENPEGGVLRQERAGDTEISQLPTKAEVKAGTEFCRRHRQTRSATQRDIMKNGHVPFTTCMKS